VERLIRQKWNAPNRFGSQKGKKNDEPGDRNRLTTGYWEEKTCSRVILDGKKGDKGGRASNP